MAIPVYLWLKDDGGNDIKGSVDVLNREGSIEVVAFIHELYLPTDDLNGKITGTRIHQPVLINKEAAERFIIIAMMLIPVIRGLYQQEQPFPSAG